MTARKAKHAKHAKKASKKAAKGHAPKPPQGPAGMARALAMASAEMDDVEVKSAVQAPPPAAAAAPPADHGAPAAPTNHHHPPQHHPEVVKGGGASARTAIAEDTHVVAKQAAKFSMADLEALRKAIVVKGAGRIVAGINLDEIKYDQEGLVPVIAQDRVTGSVLMQAYANKEALEKSLTTSQMTYFSRSRNKLWTKGDDSGNSQKLVKMELDCDKDSVLAWVEQTGVACHLETGTCWSQGRAIPVAGFVGELDRLIESRSKEMPEGSYTTKLLDDPGLAAGKVVEEAKEVATVVKGKPNKDTLAHEAADLVYHLLVACRARGVGWREIVAELASRHGETKDKKKE